MTLEFDYESTARARLVAESVAREVGEIDDERSQTTIDWTETTVLVDVDARDLVALRAALNTWCSLVSVAERVADAGDRYADGT